MTLALDRNMFTQIGLDSAALTLLGSVAHGFPEAGEYRGAVHSGEKVVAEFSLRSDKASPAAQVTIDLASLAGDAGPTPTDDCGCGPAGGGGTVAENRFVVNPRGYALFRVSAGSGGYYATVRHIEASESERGYDTRALAPGDVFAATVLRPGRYEVRNERGGARAELRVTYPDTSRKGAYVRPDPVRVSCGADAFEPARLELEPAQGLVFDVRSPSQIIVRLVEPDDGPSGPGKARRAGWRARSAS